MALVAGARGEGNKQAVRAINLPKAARPCPSHEGGLRALCTVLNTVTVVSITIHLHVCRGLVRQASSEIEGTKRKSRNGTSFLHCRLCDVQVRQRREVQQSGRQRANELKAAQHPVEKESSTSTSSLTSYINNYCRKGRITWKD